MPNENNQNVRNISAIIITKNEAKNIGPCILALNTICDDIVVIDSYSEDNTCKIAETLGARVYQKSWEGYGCAKNFGANKAKHEWILSIDADERLDAVGQDTIRTLNLNEKEVYAIRRLNYIGEKAIKYGEWNPDIKSRLYHRKQAQWNLDAVHESLEEKSSVDTIKIEGLLHHYSYVDVKDLEKRLDHYSKLAARNLYDKKVQINALSIGIKPVMRFLKSYIFKLGFLDGGLGWKIAILNTQAVKKRYIYLKEMIK